MLIDNGLALDRHKTTGRPLNKWKDEIQRPVKALCFGKHNPLYNAFDTAYTIAEEYKKVHPRTTAKTLEVLKRLVSWLIINDKLLLQVNDRFAKISYRMLLKLVIYLEDRELVEVFQGYGIATGGARPMATKATTKLLKYKG